MNKNFLLLLALLSLAFMTTAAMAASHEHGAAAPEGQAQPGHEMPMGHQMPMGHEMPTGHDMAMGDAQMIMLGDQVVDGVKADAHLNDVKEAMAKMGMKETHHLMVMFKDETGKVVEAGTVALKVKGPDKIESAAIPLMGMGGHFGADIVLGTPGPYTFTIGTKLADGKTRQFAFTYELK